MEKAKILELRKRKKAKNPKFIRQDAHKKARLGKKWRSPRGYQSKVRLSKKGYRRKVKVGYKKPAAVKGMHKTGFTIVVVHNPSQLAKIDKESQAAVIAAGTGKKNKIGILKKADEIGIRVLNFRDIKKKIAEIEEEVRKRKEAKEKTKKAREEKKKEKEKKAAEKKKKGELAEKVEKEVTEEEKQAQEKKEKDKILRTKN